ncbi:MAG: hypothetical protein Q9169_003359 [Polycauliona sp. 2 TL-2023]
MVLSTAMRFSRDVCFPYGTLVLGVLLFLLLQQLGDQYVLKLGPGRNLSHGTEDAPDKIRMYFPLEDFPKRIWTTGPLSPMRIKKDTADWVRTWTDLNPQHRYEHLTRRAAESYVKSNFRDESRIVDTYMAVGDDILRADLIRYLALFKDGGVYNDLDVGCVVPIDQWIPPKFKKITSIVVGIEGDNNRGKNGSKIFGFASWTLMARPDQPFMRYLIDAVIRNLDQAASKHNQTLGDLTLYRQEVLDVTGPGALTQTVFKYLSEKTQTTITAQNFTKMKEPRLIQGLLILPINSFGAAHQVRWSGAEGDGSALVHHYFAGTWKNSHPEDPSDQEIEKAAEEKKKEAKTEEEKGK